MKKADSLAPEDMKTTKTLMILLRLDIVNALSTKNTTETTFNLYRILRFELTEIYNNSAVDARSGIVLQLN